MEFKVNVRRFGSFNQSISYFEVIEEIAWGDLHVCGQGFEFFEKETSLVPPMISMVELFYLGDIARGFHRVPLVDTERWLNFTCGESLILNSLEGPDYRSEIAQVVSREDASSLLRQIENLVDQARLSFPTRTLLAANPILRSFLH